MGRSGSTLVQGLLNLLPSTVVRGESRFFVHKLFEAHEALAATKESHGRWPGSSSNATGAWFGAEEIEPDVALRAMSSLALIQLRGGLPSVENGGPHTIGFKEIRWSDLAPESSDRFAGFLNSAFGRVGWVLHDRDIASIRQSGWWARASDLTVGRTYERVVGLQDAFRANLPRETILESRYETLVAEPSQWIKRLLEWAAVDRDSAMINLMNGVLAKRHGPPTQRHLDLGLLGS